MFQKDSTFINMIDYIFLIIVILGQSNEPLDLRFRLGSFYLESVLWVFFQTIAYQTQGTSYKKFIVDQEMPIR